MRSPLYDTVLWHRVKDARKATRAVRGTTDGTSYRACVRTFTTTTSWLSGYYCGLSAAGDNATLHRIQNLTARLWARFDRNADHALDIIYPTGE